MNETGAWLETVLILMDAELVERIREAEEEFARGEGRTLAEVRASLEELS